MWIFSKIGFVSVVQNWENSDELLIRGRAKEDIDRIGSFAFEICNKFVETKVTMDHDYYYRIKLSKKDFGKIMCHLVGQIDYTNFKAKIHEGCDLVRDGAYAKVWATMYDFQNQKEEING